MVHESQFLQAAQQGDSRSFEKLIRPYESKIYNLLLRILGSEADAHDAFQETFLSAWKNLKSFQQRSAFATWLYRIAVNTAKMRLRKKNWASVSLDDFDSDRRSLLDTLEVKDWSSNPLASLMNEELKKKLAQSIESLPQKYKTVLVLSDLQGLRYDEIAEVLKISLASVKTRLHRARMMIREKLTHYFEEVRS